MSEDLKFLSFRIDKELIYKFKLCCMKNKKSATEVLREFINGYIRSSDGEPSTKKEI